MESCSSQTGGEAVTELQAARLDRLAERIKALPEERKDLLMAKVEKQVLTLEEAAIILDCHKETLRRAIKAGKMKAGKIGKDYRIGKPDLEEYYRSQGGGRLFFESDE